MRPAVSLFDKLSAEGAKLCVETMKMIEDGTAEYTPQNSEEATHTSMISKELGFIDWTKPAVEIERLIRGLNPWPSAYTHLNGKTFKVWSAKVIDGSDDYEPGCIYHIGKNDMYVQTGKEKENRTKEDWKLMYNLQRNLVRKS